ncbi:hypothetical protein SCMU_05570 [Sinomonas cyclohexanicum]|uniref:DNA polymerase III subunits gamma and tau n=1 Tax=Sinomonas cyclohexanicum TaxID=322009 RepID=A0ABM7PR83_SINCY|nr:hypothetical protein SCMU_05570 [Corynebacterium cyclohexanicum]
MGPNASVAGFDGRTLALAFGTSGLAAAFTRGDHSQNLNKAIQTVLGVDCQIDAVTGGNGPGVAPTAGGDHRPKAPADPRPGTPVPEKAPSAAAPQAPEAPRPAPSPVAPAASRQPAPAPPPRAAPPVPTTPPAPTAPPVSSAPSAADVAWGLAPAPVAPATETPAKAASQNAAPPPQVQEPTGAATPPRGRTRGERTAEDGATRPSPAPRTRVPSAAAPAPYDDVPFSDEEPPGEWDEPYPEDPGYGRAAPGRPAAPGPPTRQPEDGPRSEPPAARETTANESAEPMDPWSYARESTPGVWSVGAESNVRTGRASEPRGTQSPVAGSPAAEATQPREAAAASPSYAPAAAQPPVQRPAQTAQPVEPAQAAQPPQDAGRKLSMYERLSQKAAAERSQAQHQPTHAAQGQDEQPQPYVEDIPSADDETIENSALFGRAAVERILGGRLIEERGLDGTVIPPR